jgi:hypothetical protein
MSVFSADPVDSTQGAAAVDGPRETPDHIAEAVAHGASEQSTVMVIIMCGLSTGAMTAFAPSLWMSQQHHVEGT